MSRRQRLLNILANFGGLQHRSVRWELDGLLAKHGFEILTDDAVENLTTMVVRDWRRTQRMNRENRARRAS